MTQATKRMQNKFEKKFKKNLKKDIVPVPRTKVEKIDDDTIIEEVESDDQYEEPEKRKSKDNFEVIKNKVP